MRRPLCLVLVAAALAACQMPSLPRPTEFQPGAWRTGLSLTVAENSTQANTDVSGNRMTYDVGRLLGHNGEFGGRASYASLDETGVDVGSLGVYGRYWFPHDWMIRPWAELSLAVTQADYGSVEQSGWEYGAGLGGTWWFLPGVGLEAFLRETLDRFETDELRSTEAGLGLSVLW